MVAQKNSISDVEEVYEHRKGNIFADVRPRVESYTVVFLCDNFPMFIDSFRVLSSIRCPKITWVQYYSRQLSVPVQVLSILHGTEPTEKSMGCTKR